MVPDVISYSSALGALAAAHRPAADRAARTNLGVQSVGSVGNPYVLCLLCVLCFSQGSVWHCGVARFLVNLPWSLEFPPREIRGE